MAPINLLLYPRIALHVQAPISKMLPYKVTLDWLYSEETRTRIIADCEKNPDQDKVYYFSAQHPALKGFPPTDDENVVVAGSAALHLPPGRTTM